MDNTAFKRLRDFLVLRFSVLQDDFFRHSSLMMISSLMVGVLHLWYRLFLVKTLSPSDLGTFDSLLSTLLIVSVLASALQTVFTKFISAASAHRDYERVTHCFSYYAPWSLFFAAILWVFFVCLSGSISQFLKIPSGSLVMMLGFLVFFSFVTPIFMAVLWGLQRFRDLALNSLISVFVKLAGGVTLVLMGTKVFGALSGYLFGGLASILFAYWQIFKGGVRFRTDFLKKRPEGHLDFLPYFFSVGLGFFCLNLLTNQDMILVKHYFSAEDAGFYSIARTIGLIILFFPGAICSVLFAKASTSFARNQDSLSLLKKGLLYVGLSSLGITVFCLFFPQLLLLLMKGKVYPQCIGLVRTLSLAMSLYSIDFLLVYYYLSIQKSGFIYILTAACVVQTVLLVAFHRTLFSVTLCLLYTALGIALVGVYQAGIFHAQSKI